MRLHVHPTHPEPRKIAMAAKALRQGEVIAYPTDTVYGLGADATQKKAVDQIYQIKRIKVGEPMALLVPDLSNIARIAQVDNRTYRILKRLTPGPYCFILPATRAAPKQLVLKQRTVGIRVPDHPVTQALLREIDVPLVSTSASIGDEVFGDPEEIEIQFGKRGLSLVLDADWLGLVCSTVVDLTGPEPVIIREGLGDADAVYAI